jgi:hypothetical protein
MEINSRTIWTKVCPHCRKTQHSCRCTITTRKNEDEPLSETEEGLVLSHTMCAVEQDETIVMSESKEELVTNIMNFDEIKSEELPMSPDIIAREQKKDSHLKEMMKKS